MKVEITNSTTEVKVPDFKAGDIVIVETSHGTYQHLCYIRPNGEARLVDLNGINRWCDPTDTYAELKENLETVGAVKKVIVIPHEKAVLKVSE